MTVWDIIEHQILTKKIVELEKIYNHKELFLKKKSAVDSDSCF